MQTNQILKATAQATMLAIGLMIVTSTASADTLTQWTFEAPNMPADATAGTYPNSVVPVIGTGVVAAVHASGATMWSTPVGNGSADSFSSNTWGINDYVQFQTSTTGFSQIGISWDQTSSNTGPRDFSLLYSTDGTNFTLAMDYMVLANAAPNPTWNGTTVNSIYSSFSDLSSISALNNAANVFFRFINTSTVSANGGTVAAGGTSRFDNVTIQNNIPEPAAFSALLGGAALLGLIRRRRS